MKLRRMEKDGAVSVDDTLAEEIRANGNTARTLIENPATFGVTAKEAEQLGYIIQGIKKMTLKFNLQERWDDIDTTFGGKKVDPQDLTV